MTETKIAVVLINGNSSTYDYTDDLWQAFKDKLSGDDPSPIDAKVGEDDFMLNTSLVLYVQKTEVEVVDEGTDADADPAAEIDAGTDADTTASN